jgi:integrase
MRPPSIHGKFYVRKRPGTGAYEISIREAGKTKPACPRALYKHLDGQPEHNVWHWISQNLDHPETRPPLTGDLSGLVDRFVAYYRDVLEKSDQTYSEHKRHLLQNVIPYFLTRDPPFTDPNHWHSVSQQMTEYLLSEKKLTKGQVRRCNTALRKFYAWLNYAKVTAVPTILVHPPATDKEKKATPLKVFISPEQAAEMARKEPDPDLRCILLFGYFFSLRPQEIFGVKVGDLRVGKLVAQLEAAKAMAGLDLYQFMAVHITRQRDKKKKMGRPKNDSKGWVSCFNEAGAELVVETLQNRGPEDPVCIGMPNQLYKTWRMKYGFKPKDLRRASLYWLGHNTEMTLTQMMKHARQRSEEALQLYLRRPEEQLETWTGLSREALKGA